MNSQGLRWLQLPAAFSYEYFIVLTVNKLPLYRYCDTFLDRVITTFIITHNLKQTNLYLLFISSWLNPKKKPGNVQLIGFTTVSHLMGILTRRYRSMAIASRERMELCVMISSRQERKRQV